MRGSRRKTHWSSRKSSRKDVEPPSLAVPIPAPRLVKRLRSKFQGPGTSVADGEPFEVADRDELVHVRASNGDLDVVVWPRLLVQMKVDRPPAGDRPHDRDGCQRRGDLIGTPRLPRVEVGYEARVTHGCVTECIAQTHAPARAPEQQHTSVTLDYAEKSSTASG